MLTTFCNFRCSYCFNVRKGYKKDYCTIEHAETAIRHLASANRPSYTVSLLGGEPTAHPHLPEIISLLYKHLGDRLDSLIIISNGSSLDWSSTCNIFEENPFIRENWMHDVFCTLPMCGCRVNYPIPKFKSKAEAEKIIAKKRLEQKKLMNECQKT